MLRRRRFVLLLSSALAATLACASVARAQSDAAAPPPGAPTAAPSASPPPGAPDSRPPLVGPAPPPPAPPPQSSATAPATVSPIRALNPGRDARDLAAQGAMGPTAGESAGAHEVFSEDWWGKARPVIELHGYFRTRGEVFHNFFLGRHNSSVVPGGDQQYLWPIPLDQTFASTTGATGQTVAICGPAGTQNCYDKTESSANLRLRLNPEIHISDNLRIMTQLDLLDNVVLGSTPESYAMQPAGGSSGSGGKGASYPTGYQPVQYNGGYAPVNYAPIGFQATTQGPPTAGVNGWTNSINVNRVWGEYMTPLGLLEFGRMPQHWGLGMVANSGDGIDSDYQSTVDRLMFVSGIKSMDLYFGGAWDFPNTGPTSANPFDVYGGQPYNTCNLCNVNEWVAFIAHRTNPELQKAKLGHGDIVLNGGLYTSYRWQYNDIQAVDSTGPNNPNTIAYSSTVNNGLEPRRALAVIPDLWVQALWRKLRFEAEAVTIQGQIGYSPLSQSLNNPVAIHQYGIVTQTEYRAVDDKLDLQFGFGWASGDPFAENSGSGALQPGQTGLQAEYTQNGQPSPISTFRFHPDYRVDLIFWREIMTRVEGAYYFRPSVDYDFLRNPNGEKFGGGAAFIWSRASEFEQTPGHHRDLGVEMDLQLYYQSKDGSLNDDPTKFGGFYTMLQYGVFFPLAGLDYLPGQVTVSGFDASLSAAQTVRLFLGIVF